MRIQKATVNELDSLTELFDLYRLFYGQESNLEDAREFLKERLVNEESVVFIAFDENNPIGFVQLYPSFSSVSMKRSWVLNDLYVKEDARKKGFAEMLIKKAIAFAEETGANHVIDCEQIWVNQMQGTPVIIKEINRISSLNDVKTFSNLTKPATEGFIKSHTSEAGDRILVVKSRNGTTKSFSYDKIIAHIISHEIHHIGQLSVWSRDIGLKPVSSDLIFRDLI